jgi:hypothetical protein
VSEEGGGFACLYVDSSQSLKKSQLDRTTNDIQELTIMTRTTKMKLMSVGLTASLTLLGLALPTVTRADNVVNITIPIDETLFASCGNGGAGEDVHFTGDEHSAITVTVKPDGGFKVREHTNYQGVAGVGLISGDKYRIIESINSEADITAGAHETTLEGSMKILEQGAGGDLILRESSHITINANGDVTSLSLLDLTISCR